MKKATPEQWAVVGRIGIVCGVIGLIGLAVMIPVARAFALPFPRYFFPLMILGVIYCILFLTWRIRRMKRALK
jgi:hypothetical protein